MFIQGLIVNVVRRDNCYLYEGFTITVIVNRSNSNIIISTIFNARLLVMWNATVLLTAVRLEAFYSMTSISYY